MKFRLLSNPRDPAQRDYWQKVKAQGKKSYILRIGVIRWGGAMFVVNTTTDLLRHAPSSYVFDIAVNLLIWPLGGYLFGLLMWHYWAYRFERQVSRGGEATDQK
ncbi:MAG: hypothetical protein ABSD64_02050 [Terriglobales bacterium]|jgi:hypothetical protein